MTRSDKMKFLQHTLHDARGGKVIFVSHCILNTNARYLGGAERRGSIAELVSGLVLSGVGIYQIPCPEQHTWGGILKPWLWLSLGMKGTRLYPLSRFVLPVFVLYTRLSFRRQAVALVKVMQEYLKAGYSIVGVYGVDGSPSCGVTTTMDLTRAFESLAELHPESLDRSEMNKAFYTRCLSEGRGLFMKEMELRMRRKRIKVPTYSYDLVGEIAKT